MTGIWIVIISIIVLSIILDMIGGLYSSIKITFAVILMDIFKVIAIGLIGAIIVVMLKR